jgi:hypothetical protein
MCLTIVFFYFTNLPNYCGLNRNDENNPDYLLTSEEKNHFINKCELSCGVAIYALHFFVVQTFS